jgi:nucleoside-diphosphate-sugar epimerase
MVVSILGCGWLGSALGKHLVKNGHQVNGSVTKPAKLSLLENMGMQSFLLEINDTAAINTSSAFWDSDALVISSNVKLDINTGYINGLINIAEILPGKKIKRVIVVSSTSVYGEPNSVIDERNPGQPNTTSAQRLVDIERVFQGLTGIQTTIIRCGGLVGPGRLPGAFLAGRKDIPNGLAPVNLIHLTDCIGLIEHVLHTAEPPDLLNAVLPDHPSRAEFYTQAAAAQNLPLPEFVPEKTSWKIVNSLQADKLSYTYQIRNWTDWLDELKSDFLRS